MRPTAVVFSLTNVGKRTCRAAADLGFRYSAALLGEGGGDEGCTEISDLDPMRDLLCQGRVMRLEPGLVHELLHGFRDRRELGRVIDLRGARR